MRYKTQYECMNKECNTVILGPETRLDGINCPRCDGPVMPKPFEKHKIKTYVHYQCLCCDHEDKVQTTKEEYQEVMVCPRCKGAVVDKWVMAKYKQDNSYHINVDVKQSPDKLIEIINEVLKRMDCHA